jgi:hypothetical protein
MRTLLPLLIALGILLAGLAACGGGSAPPVEQQQDDLQPAADQSQPVEPAPDSQPQAGGQPAMPEGSTSGELVRISQATIELPPLPPGAFDPGDTELPQLLMFPIHDGKVLHDSIPISVTAIDNIGVNFVALLIDYKLVKTEESATLQFTWETDTELDGGHLVQVLVRDAGGNLGLCSMDVVLDNASDWDPPVVKVEVHRCWYDNVEMVPVSQYNIQNGGWFTYWVAGIVSFEVVAKDPGGIVRLDLFSRKYPSVDWSDSTHLGHTQGKSLDLLLDTTDPQWGDLMLAVAEDNSGNVNEYSFTLDAHNTVHVNGKYHDASGSRLPGVDVYLMPPGWDGTGEIDPSAAVQHVVSNVKGNASFDDVPVGRSWFVAVYEEETLVIPFVSTPDRYWTSIPQELTTFGTT